MCGIAGYVTESRADPELLRAMCDAIRHRGPDDDGYFVERGVALGIRRLSIIDLVTGAQPVYNEDRSVAIVYNGEAYNFPELRQRLEAKGHRFTSNTDTECVVHLYEEYGDSCVEHLRGMFAFALWDQRRKRLLLARDRAGKKPLFYRLTPDGIWFSSELKALLQDPSFPREVDPIALHHYLTYQYVPAPWTVFKGVNKLPPAHTLSFEDGKVALNRYWDLSYSSKINVSEDEASERLRDHIREATRVRLISDRPLGAFLSGGVDSSVVVAAMAEQTSGPVKTFTIGFDDDRFDERRYARIVAERFSTDHHELIVHPNVLEVLPALVWHYDEPFADSSAIPTYYLAQMAREKVIVALNGDGGDESFGGYDRYVGLAMGGSLPASLRASGRWMARMLPRRAHPRSAIGRARRFLEAAGGSEPERYAALISYFNHRQKMDLYSGEMQKAVEGIDSAGLLEDAFTASDGADCIDRVLDADVQTYLPGDLLVKMDIATMAHSLEARSPLLDHKVMEFAASLPSNMKVRRMTGKYLLRKAARGWVPDEILDRRKMGFGVPIAAWLRGELRELAHDALTDATARGRGYFKPEAVKRLLSEHDAGIDHSNRIWALLWFELWHRMFVDDKAIAPPASSF